MTVPKPAMGALSELCKRFHVRRLSLFGSVARGESRPDSDVDILVEFEPTAVIGFIIISQFARSLEDLFHRKVDLVTTRGLNPGIRDQVLKEAEVLFAA
ncbi:MAG: nucleotidyltransferase family protein [Planctomycetes bacterium]|nr:nucleotidyltransferase family protein [Planctomycetota bacterium]